MTNGDKAEVEMPGGAWRGSFRRYATALLDLLYTRRCEACDVFLESGRSGVRRWLCDACDLGMARIVAPFCGVCGEPYEGEMTESFRCGNCADLKVHFDFALAGYKAEGAVRELVHRFKYQHALHLRGLLGNMLGAPLRDPRLIPLDPGWILVPVPLFHARQREREYNQALELCRVLSADTGLPLLDALVAGAAHHVAGLTVAASAHRKPAGGLHREARRLETRDAAGPVRAARG